MRQRRPKSTSHLFFPVLVFVMALVPPLARAQRVSTDPCATGRVICFVADENSTVSPGNAAEFEPTIATAVRIVYMQQRTLHSGPLAHHWLELMTSAGRVTIGFGPATIPFIDTGQISILDSKGHIERIGGMHLPFVDFNYAKPPGVGYSIGDPVPLTLAQADELVEKQRHRKFIGPYIPIFHDCHTWACTVQASVKGKSRLPCYLLFKGYW